MKLKHIIILMTSFLILLSGCSQEDKTFSLKENEGIYFNTDNNLFPIYSLATIDTSDLASESLLLETFYNEKQTLNIPMNELIVQGDLELLLNKKFTNPVLVNVIYSDEEKEIVIPSEWKNDDTVKISINNLTKDVVYTFQVSYLAPEIETYMFSIIFK